MNSKGEGPRMRAINREITAGCDAAFARLLRPDVLDAITRRRQAHHARRVAEIGTGLDPRVHFAGAVARTPGVAGRAMPGATAHEAAWLRGEMV